MVYTWDFYTARETAERTCYRGPMIDVEIQMSTPFLVMGQLEVLRTQLLENIVDIDLDAVRTRECLLRVLNSDLGPMMSRIYPQKKLLQAHICEKKDATVIEQDLGVLPLSYEDGARQLLNYDVTQQSVDLILSALASASPLLLVAGKCAVVLIASYIELDA